MKCRKLFLDISKLVLVLTCFTIFNATTCRSTQTENMDLTTVKQLDLERYMGTWYEIARFDHSFERGMTHVTATYELRPDGKISVTNAGIKDGKQKSANGRAKQPDPSEPGKLRVAFFLFFYADYFILELDDDYQWALIGSSSDKYLWILSRNPVMAKDTLEYVLGKAKERGYDTSRLIWVEHD
jgi:apolipoprotein D and lipocalin family protein